MLMMSAIVVSFGETYFVHALIDVAFLTPEKKKQSLE